MLLIHPLVASASALVTALAVIIAVHGAWTTHRAGHAGMGMAATGATTIIVPAPTHVIGAATEVFISMVAPASHWGHGTISACAVILAAIKSATHVVIRAAIRAAHHGTATRARTFGPVVIASIITAERIAAHGTAVILRAAAIHHVAARSSLAHGLHPLAHLFHPLLDAFAIFRRHGFHAFLDAFTHLLARGAALAFHARCGTRIFALTARRLKALAIIHRLADGSDRAAVVIVIRRGLC